MSGSFSIQLITSAHAKIMSGRLNTRMLEHVRDVTFSYRVYYHHRLGLQSERPLNW